MNSEKYGIRDDSSGNSIILNAAQNNVIKVTGEASNSSGDGINLTAKASGTVSLVAQGNNEINSTDDGIYVDTGSEAKINLTVNNSGSNKIISGNNAVDFRGNQQIILKADTGSNILEANKDGLRNNGSGTIELTASNNEIFAGDNGVQVGGDDSPVSGIVNILANNGNNKIEAGSNGIELTQDAANTSVSVSANGYNSIQGQVDGVKLAGSGTVSVTASASVIEGSTINLLSNDEFSTDDEIPYNNYIFGDENGIHRVEKSEVNFNATADNNNYISGGTNGILAEGVADTGETPSILITANSGSNIIGYETFKDENGETHSGQIGENGINVTSGSVSLVAGDSNIIKATHKGVSVSGENSKAVFNGKNNSITVTGIKSTQSETSGVYAINDAIVSFNDCDNTVVDVTGYGKFVYGIYANRASDIKIVTNKLSLTSNFNSSFNGGTNVRGIYSSQSNVEIDSIDNVYIKASATNITTESANTHGIYVETKDSVSGTYADSLVDIEVDSMDIESTSTGNTSSASFGIEAKSVPDADTNATVNVIANGIGGITVSSSSSGTAYGVDVADNAQVKLFSNSGDISISAIGMDGAVSEGVNVGSIDIASSSKDIKSYVNIKGNNNTIYGSYAAIHADYGKSYVDVESINGFNDISGGSIGVRSQSGASVSLTAVGDNIVYTEDGGYYGLYVTNAPNYSITSDLFTNGKDATVVMNAKNNHIYGASYGIYEYCYADVTLTAKTGDNYIAAKNYGIYSTFESTTNLEAGKSNYIYAGDVSTGYGTSYAVYTFDNGGFSGSSVSLSAEASNELLGLIYASGDGNSVSLSAGTNYISSYAQSKTLGDLNTDDAFKDKSVISALYAEEGANISLTGNSNILRTYAEYDNEDQLERVVWAYNGSQKGTSISIEGYTDIATNQYEKSPNSLDVAIAAGTGVNLTESEVGTAVVDNDRAKVTIAYADMVDSAGKTVHSSITGDILSAYEGFVDISPKPDSNAGINIEGNLLTGNNGILNVNLGNGGTLTGRADDYGDAGVVNNSEHIQFYDPAFSSAIFKGGEVNLTMGEGSRWNVTGQSWITRVNTENSSNAVIDLVSEYNDRNAAAHALTIYELTGNARFEMSLDANRDASDMLYIKNANGNYTVNVLDAVSHDDMYANDFDGLRFATVGIGSHATFRAVTYNGGGINNIEYTVGTDSYADNEENKYYNGENISSGKPGNDLVDGLFNSDGEPGATTASVQTLAITAEANTENGTSALAEENADTGLDEVTNFKLIGVESSEISDAGKTVIDMSRANYANAVYMDTLNKRQGEARFVGDTDHGVWVRLRHDNIGKDDSFRTHNTMVEVGFEQRDVNDYGEFHTGFALDYMNGQIDYHTVDGDGDIERYGVWFYTTYLGNDGQYADLVLKYGHLKNDFDFNLSGTGVNVNGDYTNEVASISAEYGWKFSNSYNYYIEPQAQLQYSYVTGADYTTSYGTKVDLDSIHSLIGRVGFRAGKDFNTETPVTLYARADVLHEFLGDQDIYAYDNTGVMDVTYENDDTWYSAGVGLSVQSSENTYFFIEGEQVFGADNDNTYTVSGGFKHSF